MTANPSLWGVVIKILAIMVLVGLLIALGMLLHPALILPVLILLKIADLFREGFMRGYHESDKLKHEKPKRHPQTERLTRSEADEAQDVWFYETANPATDRKQHAD